MDPKEPPSPEQSGFESQKANSVEEREDVNTAESNESKVVEPGVSSVILDEALRDKIRAIIDENPKPSGLQSISNNLLVSVVMAFLLSSLSSIVGNFFTVYYSKQQLELTARRSFTDELNKIRIQKFGEVWELIDEDELAIDSLLQEPAAGGPKDPDSNDKKVDEIQKLIHRDRVIVSKNRFWLGEATYDRASGYLNTSITYALDQIISGRETDLSDLKQQRDNAKQNILHARCLFLEGELGSQSKCLDK